MILLPPHHTKPTPKSMESWRRLEKDRGIPWTLGKMFSPPIFVDEVPKMEILRYLSVACGDLFSKFIYACGILVIKAFFTYCHP